MWFHLNVSLNAREDSKACIEVLFVFKAAKSDHGIDVSDVGKVGSVMKAYVPGLGGYMNLKVDHIAVQAEYATWSATRTKGDFDIRTFEVKARPETHVEGLRPGMSVIVDWDKIEE